MGSVALDHLKVGISSTIASSQRLTKYAHEFEAQMMKELLQPVARSCAQDGEDGNSSTMGEYASEELARAISMQGGFGIAQHVLASLSHAGSDSELKK